MEYQQYFRSVSMEDTVHVCVLNFIESNYLSHYIKNTSKNITLYIGEFITHEHVLIVDIELDHLKIITSYSHVQIKLIKPLKGLLLLKGMDQISIETQLKKPFKMLCLDGITRLTLDMMVADVECVHTENGLDTSNIHVNSIKYGNVVHTKLKNDEVMVSGKYDCIYPKHYSTLINHVGELYDFFS